MLLTIFTPTYNRRHTLQRLYDSIVTQEHLFEWLVIDDGSTDGTEELMSKLIELNEISIRFITKKHGGKYSAFNLAMREAQGEYFICLDSDDQLADGAVEAIRKTVISLLPSDIGFVGYKEIINRTVVRYQEEIKHKRLSEYYQTDKGGELSLIFITKLLRHYPFPEIINETYVGENVIFDRMEMDGYTFCPLHKVIELCEYQSDGLSNNSYDNMMKSPTGFAIYHSQRINLVHSFREKVGHSIRFHAFNRMTKSKIRYQGKYNMLVMLTTPLGLPAKWVYLYKWKRWRQRHPKS